ncbi:MAG TPA: peptidoglycan-binding protein LysM [Campylobacterales bacterium]|nr:peptidoglycan-binding protein LysM [Campylobacterales bacterium]
MVFFDFFKDAGKKLLGKGDDNANVKNEIDAHSDTMPIEGLEVVVDGDTVILKGSAKSAADRAKAALIAGNIEGISKVDADGISLEDASEIIDMYYEIQKGDTLWKVATIYYQDGSRYPEIVEANQEVIKNADLIYPGQMIRIPNFTA